MKEKSKRTGQIILLGCLLVILAGIIIYQNKSYFIAKGHIESIKTVSADTETDAEETKESTDFEESQTMTSGEFEFREEDGKLFITGCKNRKAKIIIPDEIEGMPVEGLDSGAFGMLNDEIKTITLPKSIAHIEEFAFSDCTNLEEIEVSKENKYFINIDGVLFNKDQTILFAYPAKKQALGDKYEVPKGVKRIAEGGFANCKTLRTITLPEGLTTIGESGFFNCANLEELSFPEGMMGLKGGTLQNTALRKITIPSTMTDISESFFVGQNNLTQIEVAENNKVYKSVDGVLYDKELTTLIKYPAQKNAQSYSIPESVKVIKWFAFHRAQNLEEITLPEGLKEIEMRAFSECTHLSSINLPESLTYLGEYAFYKTGITKIRIPKGMVEMGGFLFNGCESLETIEVDNENKCFKSVDGVLFDKAQTVLLVYPPKKKQTTYEVPEGTIIIEEGAFIANNTLAKIQESETSKQAAKNGFLENIILPQSVKIIQDRAFCGRSDLRQITIKGKLLKIGDVATYDTSSLTIYGQKGDSVLENYLKGKKATYQVNK